MFKRYASAELLFKEAEIMSLKPKWETPLGLFSFIHNDHYFDVYYTKLHFNSQLGSWMCQDKYLTHIMLRKHNLPEIPFCYTTNSKEVNRFFDANKPLIQKPVLGQKAENTFLIKEQNEIRQISLDTWIFEKYIRGTEYRCLVLRGKVIAMQEKKLNKSPEHPWKKTFRNLHETDWYEEMVKVSERIAKMLHMGFLAVDFILDENKKVWVLETNSMPGIYSFHYPDLGKPQNIAKEVLEAIIESGTRG